MTGMQITSALHPSDRERIVALMNKNLFIVSQRRRNRARRH
jgi:hypothetical protein